MPANQKPRTARPPRERREFSSTIKQRLLDKLGPRGYGRLLEDVRQITGPAEAGQ